MFRSGFAKEIITPPRGADLAGYFDHRYNQGVLDDLFVRVTLFDDGRNLSGIVSYDLCFITAELLNTIREAVQKAGFSAPLIYCATHTHTGPMTGEFFGMPADEKIIENLAVKTVFAVLRAQANLAPAELFFASAVCNRAAFNRRYRMRDGRVSTNPGKLNPRIVAPEGTVDREISLIGIRQNGRWTELIPNIVNHTDTIAGDLVSADWPGFLERELQERFGYGIPVQTLIGCSGNINHFDVSIATDQTSYAEARRIGHVYADDVEQLAARLEPVQAPAVGYAVQEIGIAFRTIRPEEVAEAKATLAKYADVQSTGEMTSEGLEKMSPEVACFFANQLVKFAEKCSGKTRRFELAALKLADSLAIGTLPGEPFTEIGLEIKKQSPFRHTVPVSLAMGECGYIPLPSCKGGYEPLPVVDYTPDPETTAPLLIETAVRVLKSL